jgi:hypothetical protein
MDRIGELIPWHDAGWPVARPAGADGAALYTPRDDGVKRPRVAEGCNPS